MLSWVKIIARNQSATMGAPISGLITTSSPGTIALAPTATKNVWAGIGGVVSVTLPARSPNLNAYAEWFVRTIKESCLERLILFGEGSVRRAASEFTVHYHRERTIKVSTTS